MRAEDVTGVVSSYLQLQVFILSVLRNLTGHWHFTQFPDAVLICLLLAAKERQFMALLPVIE